jgi:hypothetical protein
MDKGTQKFRELVRNLLVFTSVMITRLISGGQTGVDRASLDLALELGVPTGGWCPKGRKAEDGPIPPRYPLTETPHQSYKERTEWNVHDSDGTLVMIRGTAIGGTKLTIELAQSHKKPHLILDLSQSPDPQVVVDWLSANSIHVLNVAGPRQSQAPGIYAEAYDFLRRLFAKPGFARPRVR